jgi:nicotinamide riboside kinase
MEENLKQQHSIISKIALFGPESTGKTTLSKQLAAHFQTVWAPEFAREYLQQKWDTTQQICEPEDLLPIAIGQTQLENEALLTANQFLFCDTCLMVTKVFSEIYYNFCDPVLDKAARKHKYDLFFLTDVDVPWEKDDLRDAPEQREMTFDVFKKALIDNDKPFITLSGNAETRLKNAIKIIEDLMQAKTMGFSSHDFVQIYQKGILLKDIRNHLDIFKHGIAKAILEKPATKNDGIIQLKEQQFQEFSNYFDTRKETLKLLKFVPASGAASRMFKFLNEFLNEFDIENETINGYINKKNDSSLTVFLTGMEKFPFFDTIDTKLKELYPDFSAWQSDLKNYHFIKLLLDSEYFNFSNKPKAILPFHRYPTHIATPIEEHLNESALYANSKNVSHLHFTISDIHQSQFERIIEDEIRKVETKTQTKINITFSFQNPSTDTIAVDLDNMPFRNDVGKLVFRPAGHGALIDNLNQMDADVVFIKNIDNVIQNHIKIITLYKKALAGILLRLQARIFKILNQIETQSLLENELPPIIDFVQNELHISIIEDFSKYTPEHKILYIKEILNRPIRICGMVKNEGEPGGGPFWARDNKGNLSLQIIETSQIDLNNPIQAQILNDASHFNPVDLVCGIKDFQGNKFDLNQFVDHNSGFIVYKSKNGKELKAYELPGLWNGAMAKWITIFVEVPLITFNPVKTVNDLLKPPHQPH